MRDLYIAGVYAALLVLGLFAPFVFALGYMWVDLFYPQYIAPNLLGGVPVSLIMAVASLGAYVLADRRAPPRLNATAMLSLLMAAWITLTSTWAVLPAFAWVKWNWAFKTALFSVAIPFFFRSRVQIEAMILVVIASALTHILPVGIKSAVSGGRYGADLGILGDNIGLSESSGLATVCIMFIPIYLWLQRHTLILPRGRLRGPLVGGFVALNIVTAVGTVARTAIIAAGVLAASMWIRSRRKFTFALVVVALAGVVAGTASRAWNSRIQTIETYNQEDSALTRLLVWRWTLGFARDHPFGGGFEAFRLDRVEIDPPDGGAPLIEHSRAFHSLYFELLGEHGWIGLALYLAIAGRALLVFQRVIRSTRTEPGLAWCRDLAIALQCALLTVLAGGAFISIAFQPELWYLFALSTCLSEYTRRALQPAGPGGRPAFRDRPLLAAAAAAD